MKKRLLASLIVSAMFSIAHAATPAIPAYVAAAVADSARPAEETLVDASRKPAELVTFGGIKPGDKVADVLPGAGYFTRIFSKVVGAKGHVYAVVPQSIADAVPAKLEPLKQLAADKTYANISLDVLHYEDIGDKLGAPGSLDVVWTSQNYHDVYGAVGKFDDVGVAGPDEAVKLDAAAFKALKPGGVFIVVDHAAKSGTGGQDAKTLHRIEAATVIAQAKAAGFTSAPETSDVLANPQDAHDKPIFDPVIKGHTDKFVLKFRKP